MGLRFNRRIGILPGLRVNLSKGGVGLSVGGKGAWLTVGPRGPRATVGLPGTGLSWTEQPSSGRSSAFRIVFWIVLALIVLAWLAH